MKKSAQPYNGKAMNLDFLLDASASAKSRNTEDSIVSISLDTIVSFRHQKRYYSDPNKLNDLKVSIERNGVSEPVLVRPHPDGSGTYELIYGHRRVAASKLAGKDEIPVRIRSLNDEEALTLHLDENLNRQDLNALEETEAILELLAHKLKMSVEEAISLLRRMQNEARGKVTQNVLGSPQGLLINDFFSWYKGRISWESFVTSRLPLLNLPKEVLEALRNGELEYTKAIAISKVKDSIERSGLLRASIDNQMSLSSIKKAVAEINNREGGEVNSTQELDKRVSLILRRFKRSKAWQDPKKQKRIDKLLSQLEHLIDV